MSSARAEGGPLRVAIAGNPNTGKSTLFNALTGLNAKVGNYPGVTVDRRVGSLTVDGVALSVMDVPGCYSLNARSREEEVAIAALMGVSGVEAPDVVVAVVDATLLDRNLYLVLQLQELGLPLLIALNMMDAARAQGIAIDVAALSARLGAEVVPTSASTGEGLDELKRRLAARAQADHAPVERPWHWTPSPALSEVIDRAAAVLPPALTAQRLTPAHRGLALWALMSVDAEEELSLLDASTRARIQAISDEAHAAGLDIDGLAAQGRYAFIDDALVGVRRQPPRQLTWTDRLDAVFTHPVLGFGIFVGLMFLVFASLFAWADPAISAIEDVFGFLGEHLRTALGDGVLTDFLVDGVIGGVGSVLVFLPQILLLFFFIAVLEGSGYMARAAFLMDRVMKAVGLHGRAFVPMLSGYACAIPAIMATRTMERERDRLLTMMAVPLMSCSARLPVYTLVIAALFPPDLRLGPLPLSAAMLGFMYLFSTAMALLAAAVIGRTVLKGQRVPLLLELPPYRLPQVSSVARLMYERSRVFISEAGTVILTCTVVLWALLSFPRAATAVDLPASPHPAGAEVGDVAPPDTPAGDAAAAAAIANSFGGRMGRFIEPVIAPLGFDWKIGVGIIGAFAAREVFVSTMGVIYGVGADADEESAGLREKLRAERAPDGTPRYTPLVGLSLMIFFALACQCMSTLAVLKRETKGYRWPAFVLVYMTALAWTTCFIVYQGGKLLGLG